MTKRILDLNSFDGNLKYVVLGQLNKSVAFASGWPVLILESFNKDGRVVFNNNDKSKPNLFNAEVSDIFPFKNASIINDSGVTHITAEYETKRQAFKAIEDFPSDKVNIGINIVESDGKYLSQTRIMSDIDFVRGEFFCDPLVLNAQPKNMQKIVMSFDDHNKEFNYMITQKWEKMIVNYTSKLAMEYTPKNMQIVNSKLYWQSRANRIFNKLKEHVLNHYFVKNEQVIDFER